MLTGKPYAEIKSVFPKVTENKGLYREEILSFLDNLKFPYTYRGHLDWEEYLRKPIILSELKDAIISIPSTNIKPPTRHMIIWNSKKKVFWCPTIPPVGLIKSLMPKYKDNKDYYKTIPNSVIKETFFIIEAKQ
jgi:hypothetical protein